MRRHRDAAAEDHCFVEGVEREHLEARVLDPERESEDDDDLDATISSCGIVITMPKSSDARSAAITPRLPRNCMTRSKS